MYGVLVLWGVSTVIFMLFHILPGDPAQMMLDQREDKAQLERIRKKYGFDQSLTVQYAYYMNDLSPISIHPKAKDHYSSLSSGKYNQQNIATIGEWDLVLKWPYLRESFRKTGKKVSDMIAESLPATILLAIFALLPIPVTITRPFELKIKFTASTNELFNKFVKLAIALLSKSMVSFAVERIAFASFKLKKF